MSTYDADAVQTLWEDAISFDIDFQDPFFATSDADYQNKCMEIKEKVRRAKKKGCSLNFNRGPFRKAPYSEQKALDPIFRFEYRMFRLEHSICSSCFETRIVMKTTARESICARCQRKVDRSTYNDDNAMLPAWIDDDGTYRYNVPSELEGLSVAEVLLIQRVAPHVPLVHIKNGTLGIKGHVCSFLQDVNYVATRLPKLPSDVKVVKMVRSSKGKDGSNDNVKVFMVNRKRVMSALLWLVRYHRDYKMAYENGELEIDEANLEWMNNAEEAVLPSIVLARNDELPSSGSNDVDVGVSRHQCADPDDENYELESSGISCPENASLSPEAENQVMGKLKKAAEGNKKILSLDWPQHCIEAISEFDGKIRIFVNAFPHLFPGGICDAKEDNRRVDVRLTKWAKHLLFFADGRFSRDLIFPFFAYNYCLRQRNKDSGSYFVNSHISDPPRSLDELQTSLQNGDHSFIYKLAFYTKRVRGSDAYWRYKRSELYNWIHYHIAEGHGPPNGFFTLSCAEYFWPDVIRLLEDRIWIAEGCHRNGPGAKTYRNGNVIDLTTNRKARNKAVNDYAVVVQEFFIRRTEDYLNTVGREVLGIEHYWLRFEFAKGRGQIHAHALVILKKEIQEKIQRQVNSAKGNREMEAKILANWARRQFGMTAELNEPTQEGRER